MSAISRKFVVSSTICPSGTFSLGILDDLSEWDVSLGVLDELSERRWFGKGSHF